MTTQFNEEMQSLSCRLAGGQYLQVCFHSDAILRVRVSWGGEEIPVSYMVEKPREHDVIVRSDMGTKSAKLTSGKLTVEVESTGLISFIDKNGKSMVKQLPIDERPGHARFIQDPSSKLFGLGQHQVGSLDYAGQVIDLKHENTSIVVPFLLTDQGYGILWDNNGKVEVNAKDKGIVAWSSKHGDYIDYYLIYGPTTEKVIEHYWTLTGPAPMIPKWAFGFWQSKMRYSSQEELLGVAEAYRSKNYPMDILVVDFYHWTQMGDMKFDPEQWPDPTAMFERLQELGVKGMVSVWPYISCESMNYKGMSSEQLLLHNKQNETIPLQIFNGEMAALYDPFHPKGREYYWEQVKNYFEQGARIWWLDSCEPDDGIELSNYDKLFTADGPLDERINAYALLHEKGLYEGQRSEDGNKRVLIFARAAFGGAQRYGVTVWSGDIGYDFQALRMQIIAGLHAAVSGLPFWTTDIGGFQGGDPHDPNYRELYARWFQYGAFCPLFRVHGSRGALSFDDLLYGISRGDNELWSFGEELEPVLVRYDRLRYQLIPYLYSEAKKTFETGLPIMRPLLLAFPDDTLSWTITDQFMFGGYILVCPVVEQGALSRQVYLPESTDWIDYWSNTKYAGGQVIEAPAPLETMPLYVKRGSILLMTEEKPFLASSQTMKLHVKIYAGCDAEFIYYDDDGETYRYEEGEFVKIRFAWNENEELLTVAYHEGAVSEEFLLDLQMELIQWQDDDTQPVIFKASESFRGEELRIRF